MNSLNKSLPALLIALLIPGPVTAGDIAVPKGFEELAKGQTLWLDVMLYGHSLGLFQAQVDLDNVRFLQPEELAAAISNRFDVSSEQRQWLHEHTATAFKRNGQLACSTNGRAPGCDFLDTDNLAIIYDENNGRVRVFTGQHFQQRKSTENNYHQVTEQSRNALVHQQNVNFIADNHYQSATVQGNGALGVTANSFLNVDWNWQGQKYRSDRRQQADVSNAYFRYDLFKSHYVQGGIMDSRDIFSNAGGNINLSQLPLSRIRGARTGSTLAWLNQDKLSNGTPVVVFLSQDARVDAYRGSQLLASFYLNAGSHELDTRSFPAGSYTVTLRIFENNQLVRTQTTPFTHIGATQFDKMQWFVQAGVLDANTRGNDADGHRVFQGGVRFPLTSHLSLTTGTTQLSDVQYYESAVDWRHGFNTGPIDGVMTSRASYLYGSDGSSGNIQQINYNDGFSLSFYRAEMSASDCASLAQKHYSYRGCYKSTTMMFSVPVATWSTNVSYTMNSNQGRYLYRSQLPENDPEFTGGAPWEHIFVTRSRSRILQAGMSKTFLAGGVNVNTSLNAFTRNDTGLDKNDRGGFFTVSASLPNSRTGTQTRSNTTLGANWQTRRQGGDQLGYNASYSRYATEGNDREIGASFSGMNTDNVMLSAWGNRSGRYGNGSLNLSNAWASHDNRNTFSAGGHYASSVLLDRTGLAVGRWGDGTPSSAITLALDSPEENSTANVDVVLDSGLRAELGGNGHALFMVPGYRPVTLNVKESANQHASSGTDIAKGAGSQNMFMTPGRVMRHTIEISSRYTWLGKLTDDQHRPLANVTSLNAATWTQLTDGGFMMETSRPIKTLYVMQDQTFWQCPLTVKIQRDVVRHVGTTRCERLNVTQLPEAARKQAAIMLGNNVDNATKEDS